MRNHLQLFFCLTFVLLASTSAMAQLRIGAKAGANFAKVNYRVFPGILPQMNPSFQVGGYAELPLTLTDLTYLNFGLQLQGKGYKYVSDSMVYKTSATVNPLYIQVPVSLVFHGEDGGVFGGIGTYFAMGVAGKVKENVRSTIPANNSNTSENVQFGNSDQDHFRPFDFGATIEFGYETQSGLRISGEYSWGLGDFRSQSIRGTKFIAPVNHRVASICLTYFFTTIGR